MPTVAEAGGPKDYEVSGWNVVVGPRGLPPPVTEKIRKDIAEALGEKDVLDRYATFGYVPLSLDGPQIKAFIEAEATRHEAIIKRAGITLD